MEAYVAVSSLQQTIKCLKDSSVISISGFQGAIMDVLEEVAKSMRSGGDMENALSLQIRDAALEMEDVLESHISNQFLSSQSQDSTPLPMSSFSVDLEEIKREIDSFTETMNKIVLVGLGGSNNAAASNDDDDEVPSRVDFGGSMNDQYFGLSDQFTEIKDRLTEEMGSDDMRVVLLHGMAGIGKTALAKKLFHDPEISSLHTKRAFVTVGQKYRFERVLQDIQKQVTGPHEVDGEKMLLVLDDLWDYDLPGNLFDSSMIWPNRVVTILLTSRLQELPGDFRYTMRFMDKKESWDLLRNKVFDEMPCPPELEKAGKKIAEKCQGLPLTIVTVANILSKAKADEKTTTKEEFWNKVATEKRNSVFMDAYDQMFEVLYPSYDHLDIDYKPCVLYLAVFPQDHKISCSKISELFRVEGFYLKYLFYELVSNSMIIVHKWSLSVKTCSLHSAFWHMCNKEAGKVKFFHGVDCPDDVLAEEDDDLKSQRRLCIRDNVVLAFKDVYDSMVSMSKLRSLLCTGPYHQYPVPIHSYLEHFRLLRVLDALTIRFYEFPPFEVLMKLIHLRYFALTYDGKIPASIFKLYGLKYLIVHRHQSIVQAVGNSSSSYLPKEIWLMKELKYLRIMGGNLPHPGCDHLAKLKTLLDVGPRSCTKDVFESMPNLKKLGIRIELAPDSNDDESLLFDNISHLHELRKLKCIVVNPKIMSPPPPLPIFPETLTKLTLSGFGYPWEDMCKIAPLPNLEVLKLKCYAFRGPKWEVGRDDFRRLRYLLIEDCDLVELTSSCDDWCIIGLQQLIIKHCYKLQKIPLIFSLTLQKIELVECNTRVVACATTVKKNWDQHCLQPHLGDLDLNVRSTWI